MNQKAFTIVWTQIKGNIQLIKQITRNPWLHITQSSMRLDILTYSSVVKISLTGLMPHANKHAWQPQGNTLYGNFYYPNLLQ